MMPRTAAREGEERKWLFKTLTVEVKRSGTVREALRRPAQVAELISTMIGMKDREYFLAIHLSTYHQPIAGEIVSVGTLDSALVHPREVFKSAIMMNAAGITLGHNHPSGTLEPSPEDRAVYEQLRLAGKLLGIPVVDFLIVSEGRWYSFAEHGL